MKSNVAGAVLAAMLVSGLAPAIAQTARPAIENGGPGEIELWKTVSASGTRDDYEIYLQLYPNGRFASLARIRLQSAPATPPAKPVAIPPPAAKPPVATPFDINLYRLEVVPPVAAAGQAVVVRSIGLLPPSLYDLVVVVPIGAPDVTADGKLDESQLLVKSLANLFDLTAGAQIPALPVGLYEVRYLSRQYNPDGRLEVVARAQVLWQ